MFSKEDFNLQFILSFLLKVFLFLLPWQTIWIYRKSFLNGVKWEYGTLGFYASELLLWLIIILFIVWYWRQFKLQVSSYKFQVTKDKIFLLSLLSLISYLFISIVWAADKSLALQQALRVMEAVLLFLIVFIGPFKKQRLAKWFVFGAILPAALGIWQFLMQSTFASKWLGLASHPVWEAGTPIIQSDSIGRWLRAYGPFAHPNVFGGYLVMIISLLVYWFISKKLQVTSYPANGIPSSQRDKLQVLPLTIYCLLITSLFFTFSRSAWLAFAISILFNCYIIVKRLITNHKSQITNHLSLIIYPLIIFSIFSSVFPPLVQTRVSSQSISEIRSTEERVSGYREAWQLFKQQPLLGVGAGNYTLALYQLNPERPGWEYQPAHNALVLFVVEEGVVGLLLFLFVFWGFINMIKEQEVRSKYFFIPYSLFLIPLLFFDHYLYSSYIGLMLGVVFFGLLIKSSAQELPS